MKLKWSHILTMINYQLKTNYPIRLNAAVIKLLSLYTDPLTPLFLINTLLSRQILHEYQSLHVYEWPLRFCLP